MSVWVLILLLQNGYAGGVISHEFNSEASCEAAINSIKEASSFRFAKCVEK